jgi:hypothetical protein
MWHFGSSKNVCPLLSVWSPDPTRDDKQPRRSNRDNVDEVPYTKGAKRNESICRGVSAISSEGFQKGRGLGDPLRWPRDTPLHTPSHIFTRTRHLTLTLTLALPLWIRFMLFGWIKNTNHIFENLVPQGTPTILIPFIVIIETISNLYRAGSLLPYS